MRRWWRSTTSAGPGRLERSLRGHGQAGNVDRVVARDVLGAHESHADHALERRAVAHRGKLAYRLAAAQDRLAAPREQLGGRKSEHEKPLLQPRWTPPTLRTHGVLQPCFVRRAIGR